MFRFHPSIKLCCFSLKVTDIVTRVYTVKRKRHPSILAIASIACVLAASYRAQAAPDDSEQIKQWNSKPPIFGTKNDSQPVPPKFRNHTEREKEVMGILPVNERWENWLAATQSTIVPKFTVSAFRVATVPPEVHAKLSAALRKGIEGFKDLPFESPDGLGLIQSAPNKPPKFFDIGSLAWEVLDELKSLHEIWVGGMPLEGTSAYGVRLYQRGASLMMHTDRVNSHVISSIVHIAHEYDDEAEPWLIQIEDHEGTLHSVNLEPGQMLFYESAACLHGRLSTLKGKYYGSLFLHYRPVDRAVWNVTMQDVIAAVPAHWGEGTTTSTSVGYRGAHLSIPSRATEASPEATALEATALEATAKAKAKQQTKDFGGGADASSQ